jgi:L-amino acid N-acyltransferase YncA
MRIREARAEDLSRRLEIDTHYVELTHITFDAELASHEARRIWFERALWVQR